MKKLLIFAFIPVLFAGCYGSGSSSAGNLRGKTFNEQIAELEKEPIPEDYKSYKSTPGILQTADERAMEVAEEAQKERRGGAPIVESNYIFNVMPDKGTYSFDEYNQVWNDEPKLKEYQEKKRLWIKPKAFKPEQIESSDGGSESSEDYSYSEE